MTLANCCKNGESTQLHLCTKTVLMSVHDFEEYVKFYKLLITEATRKISFFIVMIIIVPTVSKLMSGGRG